MKLFILLGEESNTKLTVLASWDRLPTQDAIDKLKEKHHHQFIRFIIAQDILFMEGGYEESNSYYF